MNGTHLLGIGYRHVPGGEQQFAVASRKIREEGHSAGAAVSNVDRAFRQLKVASVVAVGAVAAVTAAFVAFLAVAAPAIREAARFEAGLIGVGKTSNIEGARLKALGGEIDALSRRLPNTAEELLGIAQAAGQLGVQGEPAILAFTETVARLGSASDLAGEEGATALARILNVTGEAATSVGTLASVIVELGNNMAATESQIARHTGEVARATAVYKIGSAQAAAIAATLAAFGVQAELSGSAVGRSFRVIETAVKSGGAEMDNLSRIAGVSAETIREAFGRDPVEAFNLFLAGLKRIIESGGNVATALKSLKLSGEENMKVLPVLASQLETLAKAQEMAAAQTKDADALQKESDKSLDSLSNQWDTLQNTISSAVRIVGNEALPAVKDLVKQVKAWVEQNMGLLRGLGQLLAKVVEIAGAIFGLVSKVALLARRLDDVKIAVVALMGLALATWLKTAAGAAALAAASNTALAGSIAAIRAGYGKLVLLNIAQMFTGWAAGAGAFLVAIGPVALVVAATAAAALVVNSAIKRWRAESEAEIDKLTEATRKMNSEWDKTKVAVDSANEALLQLRSNELTPLIIAEQEKLAGLNFEIERLRDNTKKAANGEIEAAADEIESWKNRTEELIQIQGQQSADLVNYQRQLAVVEEALGKLRDKTQETATSIEDLSKKVQSFLDTLRQATAAAEFDARATATLAGAQQHGAEAVADTAAEMEIQRVIAGKLAEAQKLGIEKTEAFMRAMGAFEESIRQAAEEQRKLAGSTTIAALERQIAGQQKLNAAWAQGPAAVAAVTDALALQEEQEERASTAAEKQRGAIRDLVAELFKWKKANEELARVDDMTRQRDELRRMVDAYRDGTRAVLEETAALRVENAVRQATAGLYGEAAEEMAKLTREREQEAAVLAGRETIAALEAEVEHLQALAAIKKENFATEEQWREAIRLENVEHEVKIALLAVEQERLVALKATTQDAGESEQHYAERIAAVNAEFAIQAGTVEALIRKRAELAKQIDKNAGDSTDAQIDGWLKLGAVAAEVISGMDSDLGKMLANFIAGLERALQSLQRLSETSGGLSGAIAGAQFGSDFGSLIGGQEDYAQELGSLGGAIGGLFGPEAGAIGALIGSVVGRFINKGVDQGVAVSKQEAGRIVASIEENDAGLGDLAAQMITAIGDAIERVEDLIGAALDTEDFKIKIRGDKLTVIFDGVRKEFEDAEEAVRYTILELVRRLESVPETVSQAMRAVLENTQATSFEELGAQLQIARDIDLARLGTDIERFFADLQVGLSGWLREVQALGIDLADALQVPLQAIGAARDQLVESLNSLIPGYDSQVQAVLALVDEVAAFNAEAADFGQTLLGLIDSTAPAGTSIADLQARFDAFRDGAERAGISTEQFDEILARWRDGQIDAAEAATEFQIAIEAIPWAKVEAALQAVSDQMETTFLQNVLGIVETYGIEFADKERAIVELRRLEFQIAILQLETQLQMLRELGRLTDQQLADYQAWLDAIRAAPVDFSPRRRGGGRQRGQDQADAAEEFAAELAGLQASLAGVSDRVQGFNADVERLSELAAQGHVPMEQLAEALSAMAALQLQDIAAPFAEAARQASETGSQTAYREAGEAAAQAFADAAAIGAANPSAYEAARQAIEDGLKAGLHGIGQEALAALGGRVFELQQQTSAAVKEIGFLLAHLDDLGITAGQVVGAVRQGVLPGLFDIIEAQARRVGDERTLSAIQGRRAAFELAFQRVQFENMVLMLEAAGAVTPGLQAMIDKGRELFDLPGISDDGELPQNVDALRASLDRLVDQGLSPALASIRQANRAYRDLVKQIDDANLSEAERAAAIAIAQGELDRARLAAAGSLLSEIEQLARAAGVELPVEQAREWARIQFELARAQILVALASQEMQAALAALGADVGGIVEFVRDLDWGAGPGKGPPKPPPAADVRSQAYRDTAQEAADSADALAGLRDEMARMAREAEIAAMDDYSGQMARVNDQFNELVERLQAAGATQADLAEAEMLRTEALARLQEEVWERATTDIRGLLDDLRGGEASGRPAQDRLTEQMARLQGLASAALGGDLGALEQVGGQARAVLDLIGEVFGSGRAGSGLRSQVEALLAQLVGLDPVSLASGAGALAAPSSLALSAPSAAGSAPAPPPAGVSADARAMIESLREENRLLRESLARLSRDEQRAEEERHGEALAQLVAIREAAATKREQEGGRA